eukprot:m.167288 g.167288  ORF g.167288 m.167288 type:complete len:253 (-) comp14456_c1_seq2:110-868(-)
MDGFVASIVALIHGIVASVVSENCADVLISDFNLGDSQCVKLAISKALGYGVVLGATIVKVPQIVKLVRAKSAEGVSLNAHIIELTVYTVNFAKNYRMQLPLSTWGEILFLTIQLLILVALLFRYKSMSSYILPFFAAWAAMAYGLWIADMEHLSLAQGLCIPLSAVSRLTQIVEIFKNKSVGQLSGITCFLNFAGTAARVFTTIQEVDDKVALTSFLVTFVLNGIILAMFVVYPSVDKAKKEAKKAEKKNK